MAGGTNQWPPNGGGGGQGGMNKPHWYRPELNEPQPGTGGGWGSDYGFKPKPGKYPDINFDGGGWGEIDPGYNHPGFGGGWGGPWTGGGGGFGPGLINGDGYGWHVADGPGSGMWGDPGGQPSWNGAAPEGFQPPTSPAVTYALEDFYNPETGETWTASSGGWTPPAGWVRGRPGEQSEVEEGGGDVAATPFDWGAVGAGRLAKAKEYAALGKMGRAKNVFTSGKKGGAWSPEIAQQLRTFKTGG